MIRLQDIEFLTPSPYAEWMMAGAVVLALIVLIIAIRRPDKSRLWLRIPLVLLSVFFLLLLGLRPFTYIHEKAITAILLTDEFDQNQADSLLTKLPDAQLFSTLPVLGFDQAVQQIPDASYLPRNFPRLELVYILGNGLQNHELPDFKGLQTHFLLNDLPEGIIETGYKKHWIVDEIFFVQGRYQHNNNEPYTLVLEGQSGATDSIQVTEPKVYFFDLKQPLKKEGKYLFQLVSKDQNGKVFNRERFPVFIAPKEKLNMLIVNDAPSFESKYFKNHWSDKGHGIAVRSAVSRNKFKTEFINFEKTNLDKITPSLLADIDVFLTSSKALHNFSNEELQALKTSINKGMGMVIWGDEKAINPALGAGFNKTFLDFAATKSTEKKQIIKGEQFEQKEDFELPLNGISFGNKSVPIKGEIAAYRSKGYGRIALLRSNQTYKIRLDGKKPLYNALWNEILTTINKASPENRQWSVKDDALVFSGQPAGLQLYSTSKKNIGQLTANKENTSFHLAQHPYNPEQWQGTVRPKTAGWNTLSTKDSKVSQWLYVHDNTDWKALQKAQRIWSNKDWQSRQKTTSIQPPKLRKNIQKPFPLWWFYIGLLACWGLMWLEEKL